MKYYRFVIALILAIGAHSIALAANRTVTISAPSSVYAGQSFSVPTSVSTDQAWNGEEIGFYHAEYSTNGGASWTGFSADYNVGPSASRPAFITAGGTGSTIIVRVRIAFRGGSAGDVDYNGGGIDWTGTWTNWQTPPTKYAYISVTPPPAVRSVVISAPASVYGWQSFSVPTSASTDQGGNGEQLAFYHLEYSTDGGASWTAVVYDSNAGTSATRTASIMAGAPGSTVVVRARVAFRGGSAGDVDYNGNGLDWTGTWTNWQSPPTKYAYISVLPGTNGVTWNSFNQPAPVYVSGTATASASVTNSGTKYWGVNHYVGIVNPEYTIGYAYYSLNGLHAGGSATPSWTWTVPATAGTYTYYYRAMESGIEWFGPQGTVTLQVANRPTATISSNVGSYAMGQTATVTANYTFDAAHGDNVTQTAINLVSPAGSEFTIGQYGGATSNLSRTHILNQLGTWTMKAYSQSSIDGNWAMVGSSTFNVVNSAPTLSSFTVSPATISFGQSATVSSTITDPDSNLYCLGILLLSPDGSTWLRPTNVNYSRTNWNQFAIDAADTWTSANFSDDTATGNSTTKSVVFTPGAATTRAFYSDGNDGALGTTNPQSITLTVNKTTPSGTFANSTKSPTNGSYSVVAGDFTAVFNNPYSAAVAGPSGAVTYSIAPGSPSGTIGAAVTAGTTLTAGLTYKIRATYAGNANYNGSTADSDWTINKSNQPPLTLNASTPQGYGTTQTLTTSGGAGTGAISFAIVGQSAGGVATLTGANLTANSSSGWVDVQATKAADTNYLAASSNIVRVSFGKATATVTLGSLNQTYTGTPRSATATTAPAALTPTFTYNGSSTIPTIVGSYTVVATINDANYVGTATGTLSINRAPLIITPNNTSRLYGAAVPAFTASYSGLVNGEAPATAVTGLVLTTTVTGNLDVGSYSITASGASATNYLISYGPNGTLTVNPALLTITANNASRVYGAADPTFTASYSGFVYGQGPGIVTGLTLSTTATAISNTGGYPITAASASALNYTISYVPGTLTITTLAVGFDFSNIAFAYDGSAHTPTINNPSGATYSTTGIASATNAANYSFTVTANGNYTGSATCNWSIAAGLATVTLSNLSHIWDGTPKPATATTSPAGLTVVFTYDGSSSPRSNVGSYPVVASVVDPTANYGGSASGTLTITKAGQTTLILNASPTQTFGTSQTLSTSGGKGTGAVTYAIVNQSDTDVATLNGAVLTANTGTGWVEVAATKAFDDNYLSATSDLVRINFTKASATITFGGLAQTYTGALRTVSATTTPAGLPVNLTYGASATAPTDAGSYAIAAVVNDLNYAGSASGTLVVAKATQPALTLNAATSQMLGASQTLSATGGTGAGATSFAIIAESTSGVTTVTGATLTANAGTGWADLRATKLGNVNYEDVTSNTVRVQLAKAAANVTIGNLHQVYDGTAKSVAVNTTPGGLALVITYNGSPTEPLSIGSYPVAAVVNDSNYSGSASGTLVIDPQSQSVTVTPINPNIEYGLPVTLTASGSQTGYVWGGVASGTSGSVTFTPDAGTQTVTVYAPAGGNYARSADTVVHVAVAKAGPTGTFAGKTVSGPYTVTAADLNAVFVSPNTHASLLGTVIYSVAPSTVLNAGIHTITATYPGDANHVPATVPATFVINKSTPALTWNPASIKYGEAFGAAQLNASAPIAGTFEYNPAAGTLASPVGTKSLTATFAPTDTANYDPASATATVTVSRAAQTINLPAIGTRTYGDAPFSLAGTASSGLQVQYSVSPSNLATITNGSILTIKGAGAITVTATQSGDASNEAASPVSQTFTVNKANQTISFPNPEQNGFALLATASSGLPVSYASSNTNVAQAVDYAAVDPNLPPIKMLVFIGNIVQQTVTVTASQAGDANYNPAPSVTSPILSNSPNDGGWLTRPPSTLVQRAMQFPLRYAAVSVNAIRFECRMEPSGTWEIRGTGNGGGPTPGRQLCSGDVYFYDPGVYTIRVIKTVNGSESEINEARLTINVVAGQTITFPAIGVRGVGDSFGLGATASSGLSVTYAIVSGPASLSGSTLQVNGKGTITVKASQAGNSQYAPALEVTQTFLAVDPPRIEVDSHSEPADPLGNLLGTGWAFDPQDGAPITVQLVIDGLAVPSSAVTNGGSRPDVQNLNLANGWTTKDVTSSGWSFTYDLEQLAYGNHSYSVRATNSMGVSRSSATWNFTGGSNRQQQTINFPPLPNKNLGDPAFQLSATATSTLDVTYTVVSGPASVSGNTVTLNSTSGLVTIRASQAGNANWAPAIPVERSFVLGSGGGTGGGGYVPGMTTYPITLAVLGKGTGSVSLTVNNRNYLYTFSGATGWVEGDVTFNPYPTTPGLLFPELQLGANYPVLVASSGVTDYVVKVTLPGYISQRIPVAIECGGSYVNSITKSEVAGGSFNLRVVPVEQVPFATIDMGKFEVQNVINFGLGTSRAGESAGMFTYTPGYRPGLIRGPALEDVTETESHVQAKVPSGYADLVHNGSASTLRFYPNGSYTATGGFNDFSQTTPLATYTVTGTNQSLGSITRTASAVTMVFDWELVSYPMVESTHDFSPHQFGQMESWRETTESSTFFWPWRVPGKDRTGLQERLFRSIRLVNKHPINGPQYFYEPLKVILKKYKVSKIDTRTDEAIAAYEVHTFAHSDKSLASELDVAYGFGTESRMGPSRASDTNNFYAHKPVTVGNGLGGGSYIEYYTVNMIVPGSFNLEGQPSLSYGEIKTVRQGFLDDPLNSTSDLVTTYRYKPDLVDGRAVPASTETKQGAKDIGSSTFEYATAPFGGLTAIASTVTTKTTAGGSTLTKTLRKYSQRLSDINLRDKPVALTNPDGTKTSYAYARGTLTGSVWTNDASGLDFLIAELKGKTGTTIASYAGTAVDPLGMDPNHSTVTERVINRDGRIVREASYVYTGSTNFAPLNAVYYAYDVLGNLLMKADLPITVTASVPVTSGRVIYQAEYAGWRKSWETDEQGIKLSYAYDDYDRVRKMTRASASYGGNTIAETTTTYDYDPVGRLEAETISDSEADPLKHEAPLVTKFSYDTGNRPRTRLLPGNLLTTTAYDPVLPTKTTTTLPGGGEKVELLYKDGRTKSITGSAVVDSSTTYSFDAATGNLSKVDTLGTDKKTTTVTDWMGRPVSVTTDTWLLNGTRTVSNTYNSAGQLESQETKSGSTKIAPTRLYFYDGYGRLTREGLDVDGVAGLADTADYGIKEYESYFQQGAPGHTASTNWYRYEGVKIWPYDGTKAATSRYASQHYEEVGGLGAATAAHEISFDFDRNRSETTVTIDRAARRKTMSTTLTGTSQAITQIFLNGLSISSTNAQGHTSLQTYDSLGRPEAADDPRTGTTSFEYYPGTYQIRSSTTPDLESATYRYDAAGRVSVQANDIGKKTYFKYDGAGNLTHQWGETSSPVRYDYNELGQKTKMHTYRTGTAWTGETFPETAFADEGDVTTWTYQAKTALLIEKKDAELAAPAAARVPVKYEYNHLDQVTKRTDSRGWVTAYEYNDPRGQLSKIHYSDAFTTDVTRKYDRAGRLTEVTDAAVTNSATGSRTFAYYDDWANPDPNSELRNRSARLKKETLPDFYNSGATSRSLAYDYQYESAGRANGNVSGLKIDDGASYQVTYDYDEVMRPNGVTYQGVAKFTCAYVGQSNLIDTIKQTDGYSRDYDYQSDSNRLDVLKHSWGTVTASQLEARSTYDFLGRRNTEKTLGTGFMAALLRPADPGVQADYTYTDRSELDFSGKYRLSSTWEALAPRAGTDLDYEYDDMGNRENAGYGANALNQYTAAPGMTNLVYDENGNLTNDGSRSYTYDGENRLITVTQGGSTVTYVYDYLGRRIKKSGGSTTETRYLYDGWNLIAELDASGGIVRRFGWGLDVSGTSQGAGGVGGLLVIEAAGATYYPVYDTSHNVIALYASGGTFAASYEYDAFGNQQSSQGAYAGSNPFRSATKYTDAETGLVYYGMRYYSPVLGRFINRDPIEESGGMNLYAFCGNDGVNNFDVLGMSTYVDGDPFDNLRRTGDPRNDGSGTKSSDDGATQPNNTMDEDGNVLSEDTLTWHDEGPRGADWYSTAEGDWSLWKFAQDQSARSTLEYTAQNSGVSLSQRVGTFFEYAAAVSGGAQDFYAGAYVDPLVGMLKDNPATHAYESIRDLRQALKHSGGFIAGIKAQQAAQRESIRTMVRTLFSPSQWTSRGVGNGTSTLVGLLSFRFAFKGSAPAEKTTLRLPASMADELSTYQQAAKDGVLTKIRSSDAPRSNARAVWEKHNGPVPEGYDVDHIIQRQFGGTDDLANLQLKLSGLNRSQGSVSMWLNKPHPYGTIFDSVELVFGR